MSIELAVIPLLENPGNLVKTQPVGHTTDAEFILGMCKESGHMLFVGRIPTKGMSLAGSTLQKSGPRWEIPQ